MKGVAPHMNRLTALSIIGSPLRMKASTIGLLETAGTIPPSIASMLDLLSSAELNSLQIKVLM